MENGDKVSNVMEQCGSALRLFLTSGQVKPVKLDFSDFITTGDTITLAEIIKSTVTTTTPVIATNDVTLSVTGPAGSGYVDIRATLSTGETITQRITVQENNYHRLNNDYVH